MNDSRTRVLCLHHRRFDDHEHYNSWCSERDGPNTTSGRCNGGKRNKRERLGESGKDTSVTSLMPSARASLPENC